MTTDTRPALERDALIERANRAILDALALYDALALTIEQVRKTFHECDLAQGIRTAFPIQPAHKPTARVLVGSLVRPLFERFAFRLWPMPPARPLTRDETKPALEQHN